MSKDNKVASENRLSDHPTALSAVQPVDHRAAPSPRPEDEDETDLSELLGVLIEGRWLIAAATALAVAAGGLYAFTATPIYRADSLVQVEEKSRGGDPLKELSAMFTGEAPSEAEIEIIRSRSLVASVVSQLRLDVEVTPRWAPLFGEFIARRHAGAEPAAPWLWMSSHAWGGERLRFHRVEVPVALENEPLTLEALAEGAFVLRDSGGGELLRGRVGEEARGRGVTVSVSELVARPGTWFTVTRIPFIEAVTQLQATLGVREVAKNTGVIRLDLQGPDKAQLQDALDALMAAYVKQNVDRKTEEAEKTLQFVSGQLPLLKASLDEAEQRLKEFQASSGKVSLGMEAQSLVERGTDLEKQLTLLELQRAELLQRYTQDHPSVAALRRKMASLAQEKRALEVQARSLPETELASLRLSRDVKVANELYVLLLTKAQEIGVAKAGAIGNVRVIDAAVSAPRPVRPQKALTVLQSLLAGLVLGIGLAFARRSLNRGVDDPDVLEKALGLGVYGSVPFSPQQEALIKQATGKQDALRPLAQVDGSDLAVESLRSLRTSLQFSLASARRQVVMIGGSRPGVGKSFISVNLAYVLADAGKRVLLVDADLRKGQLHRYFDGKREGGLAEAIASGDLGARVRKTPNPRLDFLASGAIPSNPSELLGSAAFEQVIAAAQQRYDLVVIDGPPVLAVTDAALIGRVAGVNLLVIKSGLHPVREIALAVARMAQSGVRINGFVFNAVPPRGRLNGYGRYRYHYQYDYR